MKYKLNPSITFEAMEQLLTQKLPQYTVSLLKNPLLKYQYLEVKKSGTVGVWVRIMEKQDQLRIFNCMPSAIARAFLGVLFIFMFAKAQDQVRKEVGEVIAQDLSAEFISNAQI